MNRGRGRARARSHAAPVVVHIRALAFWNRRQQQIHAPPFPVPPPQFTADEQARQAATRVALQNRGDIGTFDPATRDYESWDM